MSAEYTVRLERVFQGPLDLLLHLVREQEVEIHEIEINHILDGYLAYLQEMEELDLELAGEFLVMAATLMAIKTRSLLPSEQVDLAQAIDPRDELIGHLIQYRRFREAAEELALRMAERARMFERGGRDELGAEAAEPGWDLGELGPFDLLATWSRLLRETNADRPHRVVLEPRPLRYWVRRVAEGLGDAGACTLRDVLGGLSDVPAREALVGSFCALLELVRLGAVTVRQSGPHAEIEIAARAEGGGRLDAAALAALVEGDEAEDGVPEDEPGAPADEGGNSAEGRVASQPGDPRGSDGLRALPLDPGAP